MDKYLIRATIIVMTYHTIIYCWCLKISIKIIKISNIIIRRSGKSSGSGVSSLLLLLLWNYHAHRQIPSYWNLHSHQYHRPHTLLIIIKSAVLLRTGSSKINAQAQQLCKNTSMSTRSEIMVYCGIRIAGFLLLRKDVPTYCQEAMRFLYRRKQRPLLQQQQQKLVVTLLLCRKKQLR